MSIENEIWKDVAGYEGLYMVSNLGRIKSFARKERIMKCCTNRTTGYVQTNLCKDNASVSITVHRLVAMAFVPNLENKPEVNHINGIKHDNRSENLEWCTHKENIYHALGSGNIPGLQGTNQWLRKLTEKDVLQIVELYRAKAQIKQLSLMYGVSAVTIHSVVKGKTWARVTKLNNSPINQTA